MVLTCTKIKLNKLMVKDSLLYFFKAAYLQGIYICDLAMDLNVLVSASGVKCELPSMMIASQHGSKAAGWPGKWT